MDNTLLRTASIVGKLCLYLLYTMLILAVLGLGYVVLGGDLSVFSMVTFTDSGFMLSTGHAAQDASPVTVPKGLLLFYGLKACLMMVGYLLVVRESLLVVDSIQSLETFRQRNITSFRKIGQLFIALFLVNLFHFGMDDGAWELTIQFEPIYLLGTLIGYVLAEIFREGNNLMEEQKLTI
jgi:hypothetical protein